MKETRTILVSPPPGYDASAEAYPVLYMTDVGQHLTHTRGTIDFLADNGLMPQMIVVGVNNTDRTRDLTPTASVMTRRDGTVAEFPTSGGAATFLDFFEKELFPYIEKHYRTAPYRVFTGHSFGGLFAVNAAFSRPGMFDAVLAISPSLRWDDEQPIRIAEKALADTNGSFPRLYVVMANEEEGEPRPNRMDRLEEVFESAKAADFEWTTQRMPEETHGTVVLPGHDRGLRAVYADWPLERDPDTGQVVGGLEGVTKHFASISERYGYEVKPPEAIINQMGYQVLGDDVEEALAAFERNTELYPGSANVYDSYAEALEGIGRLDEAVKSYARAVENAENNGDHRLSLFQANHARAKAKLEEGGA